MRFERQLPIFGEDGQQRIMSAVVGIVGCGGLGVNVITQLVAAGVSHFILCDHQSPELSNLNRQFIYSASDYRPKSVISADWILTLNPSAEVQSNAEPLTELNGDLFSGCDILVDCLDNFKSRMILSDLAESMGVPLIHGGVSGFTGQIAVCVPGKTKSLREMIGTMIDPEGTETLIFSSTSQDRYNEETGQIELSSTLTDEQVETAMETLVPGSSQWKESLPGSITFDIPAGQGTITLEGWQSTGYVLKLKMGSQPVVTFTMDDAGQCVILYDTPAAIHVVIYLQVDKSSLPKRIARVKEEEPVIGATIRSIKITPKGTSTEVDTIGAGSDVNGKVLYDGRFFIIRNGKTYTATGVEVK